MYVWKITILPGGPEEVSNLTVRQRGVSRMRKVIYWVSWLMLMAVLLFSVTNTALS